METAATKPPIGIRSKDLWQRDSVQDRVNEIRAAITRYMDANMPLDIEWIEEFNNHLASLQKK